MPGSEQEYSQGRELRSKKSEPQRTQGEHDEISSAFHDCGVSCGLAVTHAGAHTAASHNAGPASAVHVTEGASGAARPDAGESPGSAHSARDVRPLSGN